MSRESIAPKTVPNRVKALFDTKIVDILGRAKAQAFLAHVSISDGITKEYLKQCVNNSENIDIPPEKKIDLDSFTLRDFLGTLLMYEFHLPVADIAGADTMRSLMDDNNIDTACIFPQLIEHAAELRIRQRQDLTGEDEQHKDDIRNYLFFLLEMEECYKNGAPPSAETLRDGIELLERVSPHYRKEASEYGFGASDAKTLEDTSHEGIASGIMHGLIQRNYIPQQLRDKIKQAKIASETWGRLSDEVKALIEENEGISGTDYRKAAEELREQTHMFGETADMLEHILPKLREIEQALTLPRSARNTPGEQQR